MNHFANLLRSQLKKQIAREELLIKSSNKKAKSYKELENKLKDKEKDNNLKNEEIKQLIQENQQQLRKINLLFDPACANYEIIDFNGLYSLLEQIAERERERERETKVVECQAIEEEKRNNEDNLPLSPLSRKQKRKLRQKKK